MRRRWKVGLSRLKLSCHYLFSLPHLLEEEGEWEGHNSLHTIHSCKPRACLLVSLEGRSKEVGNSYYLLILARLGVLIHSIPGKDYRNQFVWVMRFNRDGLIEQIRAYYDSAHTEMALAPEMKKAQLK